ncbi:rRNA maturation RNase YbeY [Flavobacteriaceae bacterium MAR_2010_188]|nr:rRNA maturation RNase YbeY [Flavobacteriaceae bacterium MAR_2010_188]
MINYNYELDFNLNDEQSFSSWINSVILSENKKEGEISYIFCDDSYLHKLNMEYLRHDTLTDIISFDYSMGNEISGDIFISVERVKENAVDFEVDFITELKRVMIHGILHYCGYQDKNERDKSNMRAKEDHYLETFIES